GLGVGSDFLSERGAQRVWAVERDPSVLARARQRYATGAIEFLLWNQGALPLRDAEADLVVVPDAIGWIAQPEFLEEVRRVLAPSGRLLLCVPSGDRPGATGGISYYDLVERLEPMFAPVRMI